MGKPQNKKGGKNASGGTPNSKPNTPQMKKAGKQTPTPKSEQFKKVFAKEELSSDEIDSMSSNSFDEDFEALLKGPTKKTKVEEKSPKLVPAKENGQKNKQNDKAKQSPNAATPAKASPGKQTPGKADKKTPGKQPAEKITPGKKTPVKETPGKQTPGKAATPGKMEAGQKKTPAATSAVKDKQQKRKRDDSSDDEVTISTKIVKTSNTPEKATPAPQKTSPTKVASPLKSVNEKSKTPEKKVIAVQSKKRHHDESDDEEEVIEESQAKKLKAESGNGKEISSANIVDKDLRFKAQVDKSVLFIKNFTKDVTEKDITALSKDIEEVQLRTIFSKKVDNQSYAYLRFKDEKTADANYKLLSNKKLCGSEIVVDYVGEKSKNKSVNKAKPLSVEDLDPLRLYIRGFSRSTREADLRKHFPKALSVTVPLKKKDNTPIGYGFAAFKTEEDCKAAHDSMQGKVIDGKILVVLFAKKCSLRKDVPTVLQPAKPKVNAAAPAKTEKAAVNKKTKPAKKEEEVEEEEDDDEDDDDSDDEDDEKDEDESDDDDDDDDDDDEGDDDDSDDDEDESDDDDDESDDDDE